MSQQLKLQHLTYFFVLLKDTKNRPFFFFGLIDIAEKNYFHLSIKVYNLQALATRREASHNINVARLCWEPYEENNEMPTRTKETTSTNIKALINE